MLTLEAIGAQATSGVTNAMLMFLMAAGLSLIFGVVRILNFAHGSFYMVGSYLTFEVLRRIGPGSDVAFFAAAIIAAALVAALGAVIERTMLSRLYGRESLSQLLFTYAIVLAASDLVKYFWGNQQLSVRRPPSLSGAFNIGGVVVPTYSLFIIILGVVIAVGVWLLLRLTPVGRLIRAAALDREMVQLLGVNIRRLYTLVFAAGAFLAGLAGALVAPLTAIVPGMDSEITIALFIIVVVGGLGSFWGTFVASIIYGLLLSFGIMIVPRFSLFAVAALMAVVLTVKPTGLFGREVTR